MSQKKKPASTSLSTKDPNVYARPRWRHATRVFGAVVVLMFNFTVLAANIDRYAHGRHLHYTKELFTYVLLGFCDLVILMPIIFEVDILKITDDNLIIKTVFFKKAIPWEAVTEFKKPRFLVYAIIKTGRCFYLINRRTIARFDQLAQNISAKLDSLKS